MRWLLAFLSINLAFISVAEAAEGRVLKVLPQFLDKEGRHALTPSLYDRDAYQAELRRHPEKRSALRYAVEWKARVPADETLTIRLQIWGAPQGSAPRETTMELPVHQRHWFSHWAYFALTQEEYKKFGEVTAWRVSLWDGAQMLGEQKSFLW